MLPPPADGDERRGDEEFRDALRAVRERAGRRPGAVRQRGRRKRRLDLALQAGSRGADQHQPRPQGNGRAARPVRRLPRRARARRSSTSTIRRPARLPTSSRPTSGSDTGSTVPGADFMGKNLELLPGGSALHVIAGGESHDVSLNVPGRHNASNALAAHRRGSRARRSACRCGGGARRASKACRRRLETVGDGGGVTVIDDFAHNPDKIDATPRDLARAARPAADLVPAARIWTARQDGRGAGAQLRRRHGRRRPALSARSRLSGRHGRPDPRLRLAGRSRSAPRGGQAEHIADARRSAKP